MKHIIIKIYKTMIQLSMIFSTIDYYMNALNHQGEKREGVRWEKTLNQAESPSLPNTCYVCGQHI